MGSYVMLCSKCYLEDCVCENKPFPVIGIVKSINHNPDVKNIIDKLYEAYLSGKVKHLVVSFQEEDNLTAISSSNDMLVTLGLLENAKLIYFKDCCEEVC